MKDPVVIDVRGLKCPLPVLKTARRMDSYPPGTLFRVQTTDPMAAIDLPHFCTEKGHRLLAQSREGEEISFDIEKGAGRPSMRSVAAPRS